MKMASRATIARIKNELQLPAPGHRDITQPPWNFKFMVWLFLDIIIVCALLSGRLLSGCVISQFHSMIGIAFGPCWKCVFEFQITHSIEAIVVIAAERMRNIQLCSILMF